MLDLFRQKTLDTGLLFLGQSGLELEEDFARFQEWLGEDKHAGMQFLENYSDIRENPRKLFPEAASAFCIGLAYDQGDVWPMADTEPARVAQYARFRDYHKLFREKVEALCREYVPLNPEFKYRVCVDTAPVLERAIVSKSGSGFIGKNTCYIHEAYGSFLLLSIVLTNAKIENNQKNTQAGCGSCSLCQVACPTGALNQDYTLDSRKCLSYWTIEHRGEIPLEFWPHLSQYYFGCDICQIVCPFNKEARENSLSQKIAIRYYPDLVTTALMDEKEYEKYFGGTPLTRAKRNGLRRNALIALTVRQDIKLREVLEKLETDPDPVIKRTAISARSYSHF